LCGPAADEDSKENPDPLVQGAETGFLNLIGGMEAIIDGTARLSR